MTQQENQIAAHQDNIDVFDAQLALTEASFKRQKNGWLRQKQTALDLIKELSKPKPELPTPDKTSLLTSSLS